MCGRVQLTWCPGIIDDMPENLRTEPHLAVNGTRVGVQQQLGRVVPQPAARIEGSADPKPVRLPRTHPCHEPMPYIAVTLRQHQSGFDAVGVEQTQGDLLTP